MDKPKLIGAEIKALSNLIKRHIDANPLLRDSAQPGCNGGISENPAHDNHAVVPTGMQGMIMGFLAHHGDKDVFQRDIETEFNIRRSTATGILKLMEQNGWITKEPVPHDERLKKLILTPEASAINGKIFAHFTEIEAQLAQGLSKEDIDHFFRIMDIMKSNMA